jgi:hypothetical protein
MGFISQKGQTMVEYMLLLAVSISLVITFLNSDFFKKTFGTEGKLATMIKSEAEFAYRHAFLKNHPPDISRTSRDAKEHPSYFQGGGDSHFFGAKSEYPLP